MSRPLFAAVDPHALLHNYRLARRLGGASRLWAVVKAHGYGHGLLRVAQALRDEADGFALLELAEARLLRQAGFTQPILLLEGFFAAGDIAQLAELQLCTAIHRSDQIAMLAAAEVARPIPIFLKLNTGMNRLGFRPTEAGAALDALRALPQVASVSLMTHFADADCGRGIADQLALFQSVRQIQTQRLGQNLGYSLANSAALLRFADQVTGPDAWCRPGIMLYGASPFPDQRSAADLGLLPAMTLRSEIIGVQTIAPGERVGYGGTFTADRPMRVGVVACGYADGYPRHAGTGTPILVHEQLSRTLGRVSMDMLAVDLTDCAGAGVGTPVTLWGEGLPADDVATAAGTIAYELFCALAPRVRVA